MADLLPVLYQKIADVTGALCESGKDECVQFACRKYRCCERQYCEQTARFAREKYGIELQLTGNPDLPFMGESGCTVAPHLRPVCSLHVCCYSWSAVSVSPPGYQELRNEILAEAKKQNKEPF